MQRFVVPTPTALYQMMQVINRMKTINRGSKRKQVLQTDWRTAVAGGHEASIFAGFHDPSPHEAQSVRSDIYATNEKICFQILFLCFNFFYCFQNVCFCLQKIIFLLNTNVLCMQCVSCPFFPIFKFCSHKFQFGCHRTALNFPPWICSDGETGRGRGQSLLLSAQAFGQNIWRIPIWSKVFLKQLFHRQSAEEM